MEAPTEGERADSSVTRRPMRLAAGGVAPVAVLGASLLVLPGQSAYPPWFLHMPNVDGVMFAVGYAPPHVTFEDAALAASQDARRQLGLVLRSEVRVEVLLETKPGGQVFFRGETFSEDGVPDSAVSVVYLDTAQVGDMTLVLAASAPVATPTVASLAALSDQAPAWTTSLPSRKTGLYAVGVAPKYSYEHNCWLEAERHARRQLAFSVVTRQRQLSRAVEGWGSDVTASATSVILRGALVEARWRNERVCFVLTSVASASILE